MHYSEADNEYFRIVEEHGAEVFSKLSSSAYPQSYRAMIMFFAKTNSLKTAMFDCIQSNNPYSFKVLHRCFCEHYLKFIYIWARLISEESDAVGIEYYAFCGAAEARDYASAITVAEGLLGNKIAADIEAIIASLYPQTAKLSLKELEQLSGQFKYRSILRFLSKQEFQFVAKERPFLAQIVPAYALLSSFVHGGPYTDMEMAGYSEPKALQECERDAEIIFLMSATIFMLTTMAFSKEHIELNSITKKVKNIIDPFLVESQTGIDHQ